MAVPATVQRLTPAEFLELKRESEVRHEYFGGRMFEYPAAATEEAVLADDELDRVGPCKN